jgi:hypothetical protein
MVSSVSALGRAIRDAEEGEGIDFDQEDGTKRTVLIVKALDARHAARQASRSGKESITNGGPSGVDGRARHVNNSDKETAGEKRRYRDLAEFERSRSSPPAQSPYGSTP